MAHINVSREAARDLISIRDYIRDELSNPSAAARIIKELKKSILSLADFPGSGKPLDALLAVHTEYRYILCEHSCIFYLADAENIFIVRILDQRQDCLKALFM